MFGGHEVLRELGFKLGNVVYVCLKLAEAQSLWFFGVERCLWWYFT